MCVCENLDQQLQESMNRLENMNRLIRKLSIEAKIVDNLQAYNALRLKWKKTGQL